MYKKYPNLPLLENKFLMILQNKNVLQEIEMGGKKYPKTNFECLGVFIQNWVNTAGLFENGGFSGQALTTYYTTVFVEHMSGYYAIFQNNDLVYTISNCSEELLEDIQNHDIKCFKEAKGRYANGNDICDE